MYLVSPKGLHFVVSCCEMPAVDGRLYCFKGKEKVSVGFARKQRITPNHNGIKNYLLVAQCVVWTAYSRSKGVQSKFLLVPRKYRKLNGTIRADKTKAQRITSSVLYIGALIILVNTDGMTYSQTENRRPFWMRIMRWILAVFQNG